jgi:hypothetical protein
VTDFTLVIDKNALVVVHDEVETELTFIGELEPGLTASMIEQEILIEQYTDVTPSNARFTTMVIDTIFTEGGYTFEASVAPSHCIGGSYKITAVPNSNLFVVVVSNFEQKYTCPSVGLPPIQELVDTSDGEFCVLGYRCQCGVGRSVCRNNEPRIVFSPRSPNAHSPLQSARRLRLSTRIPQT